MNSLVKKHTQFGPFYDIKYHDALFALLFLM